ncbi:MAG: elongation factor G [Alphaproteobacteria bacterium]|nr:elongation factor G [Alphaproteobacteria bacterium]
MSDAARPRTIALVGPYLSGKTALLESILFTTGALNRKGSAKEGNTVGDASAEARERQMGVELNVASAAFMGDSFHFLDAPGSVEFSQEAFDAVLGADLVVVVCEPDIERARAVAPVIKLVEQRGLPSLFFINKLDRLQGPVAPVVEALQEASGRALALRQLPIVDGETVAGYVDLASGRGYRYQPHEASAEIDPPAAMAEEIENARFAMLEKMADFDDGLMETLLEDDDPSNDDVFGNLSRMVAAGNIAPVMLGAAELDHGVRRLLKALRHDAPAADATAARLGLDAQARDAICQVLKTYNLPQIGKLSLVRIFQGQLAEGVLLNGIRPSGLFEMTGQQSRKRPNASMGDIVALGRMDGIAIGDTLSSGAAPEPLPKAAVLEPVYGQAIAAVNRNDEVKLSGALSKLIEEDPSYLVEHNQDTHEMVLHGQGEIHLRVAVARLHNRSAVEVQTSRPRIPYKEAIQKPVQQHGRYKRQTGGHGQFGDVRLDIKPLPRGSGFRFEDKIVGGVIPKTYIPAVETGVKEYLAKGPLGYPVVDISVTLYDGSHHAVDSSEIAFRTAGRIAMTEALPKCSPVLLEPILAVEIYVPSDYTAKINQLISGRRGQILGFESRAGWPGWDVVTARIPHAQTLDMIVELRSLTQGVGTYSARFDHLQELTGRLADQVLAEARAEAAE